MSTDINLATSPPSALWRERRYWRSAWAVVAVFLLGAVVVGLVTHLAYPESDLTVYLGLLLHGLTVLALAVALRTFARVEVDEAIARGVETKAAAAVAEIHGGRRDRCQLRQIEAEFLPDNPARSNGSLSLFRQVLFEARDRKFQPARVTVQSLRERYAGELRLMQSFQRLALQLGILFTFVGLIQALGQYDPRGASGSTGGDGAPISIEGMFQGLFTAFGTSVAGLEVAAIVGVLLVLVRRRQARFFEHLERATESLVSLCRNAINPDLFYAELEQVRGSVEQLSERVWDQSREIEEHTREVRSGMERLADLKLRFNDFLSGVQSEQRRVLDEMRSVYDVISPKAVAEDMKQGLVVAVGEATRRIDEELGRTLGLLDPALARLEGIAVEQGDAADQRSRHLAAERLQFDAVRSDLSASLDEIRQLHGDTLSRAGTPLDQYRSAVLDGLDRSLARSSERLSGQLAQVHESLRAIDQHLRPSSEPSAQAIRRGLQRAVTTSRRIGRWLVDLGRTEVLPWRRRGNQPSSDGETTAPLDSPTPADSEVSGVADSPSVPTERGSAP